jgi:hypothetical protein
MCENKSDLPGVSPTSSSFRQARALPFRHSHGTLVSGGDPGAPLG